MMDVSAPLFIHPVGTDFNKLRMSTSTGNWFDNNDISSFLNVTEDVLEFPQSVPSSSPIATELFYSSSQSSPETYTSGGDSPYGSPYTDISQTPSPFDPAMFQDQVQQPIFNVDPALFEQCNLTNPLVLPEIEKILAANPFETTSIPEFTPPATESEPSNSKKRQRDFDIKSDVTLSREQLLTMTSKEIEEYVSSLKSKRTLTASEEKDLKKQRRLVKNREYASQSRSRKKQYVDEIEKQLEQAREETDAFKRQNHLLMEENKILKRQLGGIADAIKKSQNGTASLSASSGGVGVFTKFTSIGGGRNTSPTKTVSACLLAIFFMVFTFAAFWDNQPKLLFPSSGDSFVFTPRHILIEKGQFIDPEKPPSMFETWVCSLVGCGTPVSHPALAPASGSPSTSGSTPSKSRSATSASDAVASVPSTSAAVPSTSDASTPCQSGLTSPALLFTRSENCTCALDDVSGGARVAQAACTLAS